MKPGVVLPLVIAVSLGVACGGAPGQKSSLPPNSPTHEPTSGELLQKGKEQLVALGRDPGCFDAQIVDRLTKAPEPKDSTRPAYRLAVVFTPRGCPQNYCLEFKGMASREMSWCVDRIAPTASQERAIEVAYRRYRDEYPTAPELQALIVFANESTDSVWFELYDRKYWEDVKAGTTEPSLGEGAMYRLSKQELGLQVAQTITAPSGIRN